MASVFYDLMKKAKAANRAEHPAFHSAYEGLALIEEEVDELRREVFRRKRKGDPLRFLNELAEIAAFCEMFAEDRINWGQ